VRDGAEALDYLFGTGQYETEIRNRCRWWCWLDLKLLEIDGIEVLRRIRSNTITQQLPVVILTSSKEQSDVAACYELPATVTFRKPVDFNQFAESVKQLGLYWLVLTNRLRSRRSCGSRKNKHREE